MIDENVGTKSPEEICFPWSRSAPQNFPKIRPLRHASAGLFCECGQIVVATQLKCGVFTRKAMACAHRCSQQA